MFNKKTLLTLLACLALLATYSIFRQEPEPGDWMDRAIARDFKRYEKIGITKESLDRSWNACKKYKEFQRYQIIDSRVYGPDSHIKILLTKLVQHYRVPDVDFIYYYEDRLKKEFFKRKTNRKSAPIFVSAKERSIQHAILFAEWNYNITHDTGGWNGLIEKVNEEHPKCAWSEKMDRLLWRGTPWDGKHFGMYRFENWTTLPRGHLVAASLKEPEWIDAAFSEYPDRCAKQDHQRCVEEMGPIRYIPWGEMFHYKYQIIVDGVTCSFPGAQWKLLSGCLSFKQDSENIQYYYDELIPWKHYVPVKNDLSNLKERLLWAKTHDREAEEIANNAREFVQNHLMPEHILHYCYKTLCKYASLQTFQPCQIPDS